MSKNKNKVEEIKNIEKHDDLEGTLDLFVKNDISEDAKKSDEVENKTPDIKDIDTKKKSVTETKSTLNYIGRGFNSLEEAEDFVNTKVFARLGEADKNEYLNWLNNK